MTALKQVFQAGLTCFFYNLLSE